MSVQWRYWLWRHVVRPALDLPYRLLFRLRWSRFPPRPSQDGKKQVLFFAYNDMMAQYVAEIRGILAADHRLEFHLTSTIAHQFKGEDSRALSAKVGIPFVHYAWARLKWWDLAIFPTPNGASGLHPTVPKILTTHYTAAGKISDGVDIVLGPHTVRNGRSMFDRVFEASEPSCRIIEQNNPALRGHMVAVGDLRVDKMLRLDERRQEIRHELGFQDSDRVVLLQSTWGEESLIERMGRDLVAEAKALLSRGDCKFILSVHPNCWGEAPYAKEHPWGEFCVEQQCVGLVVKRPDDDWEKYHVAADVAISDHTSLAAAFALLQRPIYLLPLREGVLFDGAMVARMSRIVPCFHTAGQLREVVQADHADYPIAAVKELCGLIDSYPGEAEQRMKAQIMGVLNLPMNTQ